MKLNMRGLVQEWCARTYPNHFGDHLSLDPASSTAVERTRLYGDIVSSKLDGLLRNMLRNETFAELYLAKLPSGLLGTDAVISDTLDQIVSFDKGAIALADMRYLKLGNNQGGLAHGDTLLCTMENAILSICPDLCWRRSLGDEVGFFLESGEAIHILCAQVNTTLKPTLVANLLPLALDFGVTTHREVAETYRRLLGEGWDTPQGRTGKQVFLDIALGIAERRSSIVKVYERALLLTDFRIDALPGGNLTPEEYEEWRAKLTRGGKFVYPDESWLSLSPGQLEGRILLETLALLSPDSFQGPFDRVIFEVAESIYKS